MIKKRFLSFALIKFLRWLSVLAIAIFFGYSIWYTKQVNPEQGLVTCVAPGEQKTFTYTTESGEKVESTINGKQDACFWTAHIHAIMDLNYCGAKLDLPKDKANLSGPHTHKEVNKMHSPHSPQPVDAVSKQFINPKPLTVNGFLDAMDIDTKTPCPGANASVVSVTVNGQLKDTDYLWQDGDRIDVVYK